MREHEWRVEPYAWSGYGTKSRNGKVTNGEISTGPMSLAKAEELAAYLNAHFTPEPTQAAEWRIEEGRDGLLVVGPDFQYDMSEEDGTFALVDLLNAQAARLREAEQHADDCSFMATPDTAADERCTATKLWPNGESTKCIKRGNHSQHDDGCYTWSDTAAEAGEDDLATAKELAREYEELLEKNHADTTAGQRMILQSIQRHVEAGAARLREAEQSITGELGALLAVAQPVVSGALETGASKYEAYGWRSKGLEYEPSQIEHAMAHIKAGTDEDLGHAITRLLMVLDSRRHWANPGHD